MLTADSGSTRRRLLSGHPWRSCQAWRTRSRRPEYPRSRSQPSSRLAANAYIRKQRQDWGGFSSVGKARHFGRPASHRQPRRRQHRRRGRRGPWMVGYINRGAGSPVARQPVVESDQSLHFERGHTDNYAYMAHVWQTNMTAPVSLGLNNSVKVLRD